MRKVVGIIGTGFGDCAKGAAVDFYASKLNNPIVVRTNGGSQAGHSVQLADGTKHIFQHIGSGTFYNAPTYLSEFFIVNPITFRREFEVLEKLGYKPKVYVNPNCLVTTPYDMLINQISESIKDKDRHGSCGLGINETIERNENGWKNSFSCNFFNDKGMLKSKLFYIKENYIKNRLFDLNIQKSQIDKKYLDLFENENLIRRYIEDCEFFINNTTICNRTIFLNDSDIIFEGAQGLLLDQDHRFFPHVTRSKTGLCNVVKICKDIGVKEIDVSYMTRSYLTRHGAGPLPNELKEKPYSKIEDKTNIPNDWQGSLRFSYLNLDLLDEAIRADLADVEGIIIRPSINMTCMDQLDNLCYYWWKGKKEETHAKWLWKEVEDKLGFKVKYLSYGPTRNDIKEI